MKTGNLVALAEGLSQLKWEHFKSPQMLQHLTDFDTASRGPWGCVQLLIALRGRNLLAALGAIVSVLTIIVDPFTQQLISYYPCNVPATNGTIALIPRSNLYNETGSRLGPAVYALSTAQQSAIITGLFNPDSVIIPANCPTGNCTYDDTYATMGFCSECADVTDELHMSWVTVSDTLVQWNSSSNSTYSTEQAIDRFNTSLPSGLSTSTIHGFDSSEVVFIMAANHSAHQYYETTFEMILGKLVHNSTYNDWMDQQWYAESWGNYGTTPSDACGLAWQKRTWGCQGYGAARCTITPCVNVMKAAVEFGILKETVVATSSDWYEGYPVTDTGWPFAQLVMADLSCVDDDTRKTLRSMGFNVSDARFMPYPVEVDPFSGNFTEISWNYAEHNTSFSENQMSLIPKTCIYQMDTMVIEALQSFVEDYFAVKLQPDGTDGLSGPVQAFKLFNNSYVSRNSINEAIAGIAKAMSLQARQWDADGKSTFNKPAEGVVYVTDTCVNVVWPWIAFPAAIVLLTGIFLITVLVQTEIKDKDGLARGWKSSLLPLVYHGMKEAEENGGSAQHKTNIQSMNKAAKSDTVYIQVAGVPDEGA